MKNQEAYNEIIAHNVIIDFNNSKHIMDLIDSFVLDSEESIEDRYKCLTKIDEIMGFEEGEEIDVNETPEEAVFNYVSCHGEKLEIFGLNLILPYNLEILKFPNEIQIFPKNHTEVKNCLYVIDDFGHILGYQFKDHSRKCLLKCKSIIQKSELNQDSREVHDAQLVLISESINDHLSVISRMIDNKELEIL